MCKGPHIASVYVSIDFQAAQTHRAARLQRSRELVALTAPLDRRSAREPLRLRPLNLASGGSKLVREPMDDNEKIIPLHPPRPIGEAGGLVDTSRVTLAVYAEGLDPDV